MRTLYICYFGLREPLVQTQVLPYLRGLSNQGLEVHLLTFERSQDRGRNPAQHAEANKQLRAEGIYWKTSTYHKRPPLIATLFDILVGAWMTARIAKRHRIAVLHARAHVPMAMALLAQWVTGCRIIFDFRGLMAEEYADAGIWKERSAAYRAVKYFERASLRRADQVVVLTRRMREWIMKEGYDAGNRIEVIPCCVDPARFSKYNDEVAISPLTATRFELIYAGEVTGLYLLPEMARFFLVVRARRPDAFLRVLTKSSPASVAAVFHREGLRNEDFGISHVSPDEVPKHLSQARLGISFRKATFAQIAASPTKIPEYLMAGLPVVSNAGIGDTDETLESERVGIVVHGFDETSLAKAAEDALALVADQGVRLRCSAVAQRLFDLLNVGVAGYTKVYDRIQQAQQESTPTSALDVNS